MDLIINKSKKISGTLEVPSSKSYGQRALALSLLVEKLTIKNLGKSDDELAALDIVKQTGAKITSISANEIYIENQFDFNSDIEINCGESGLSARLFSCLFMLNQSQTKINAHGSLLNRPMDTLFDIYNFLNINYIATDKSFPIQIRGNNIAKDVSIDGSISSQYITGLLYYLVGLKHKESIVLHILNPTSIPYIQMSIDLLNNAGANMDWFGDDTILISSSDIVKETSYTVEGDWSSSAYFMVAAAIDGHVIFNNLNLNSVQADISIWDVLEEFGANIFIDLDAIEVQSENHFAFEFDATHCPDLIPIIAILAIFTDGKSIIYGTDRLIHKESNRLAAINEILNQVEIKYNVLENGIEIFGNRELLNSQKEYIFNSHHDHRIVMASAILSLFIPNSILKNIEYVSKSYPSFFEDYKKIGGLISNINKN